MKEDEWWRVENLKKMEDKVLRIDALDDLEKPGSGGDFGSYRKVLRGASIEETMLSNHNDLN